GQSLVVSVRVPHVHLADVPNHVGQRPGDLQTLLETTLVEASTSSTQIDIHTPLSVDSLPPGPNVCLNSLLPRPPCPFLQRKISQSPEHTPPKVTGWPNPNLFATPATRTRRSFAQHPKRSGSGSIVWRAPLLLRAFAPAEVRCTGLTHSFTAA